MPNSTYLCLRLLLRHCFLVFGGLGQQWDIALSEIVRTVLPREFAPVAKLSYFSGNAPVAGSGPTYSSAKM